MYVNLNYLTIAVWSWFVRLYRSRTESTLDTFEAIENKKPRQLIAFAGISGTGKDTCADYLVSKHKFTKFSFASMLKILTQVLYGHLGLKDEKYYNDNRDARKDVLWTDGQGKEYTAVDVWVETGTKLREVNPNTWLDVLNVSYSNTECNYVIADCRHENELKRIQELGGKVYYIKNSNVKPNPKATMDNLISEQDCDEVLVNEGTLEELYAKLDSLV